MDTPEFLKSLGLFGQIAKKDSAIAPFSRKLLIIGAFVFFCPADLRLLGYPIKAIGYVCFFGFCIWTFAVATYFAIKHPRYLQSEKFQVSMRRLDLIVASKGVPGRLVGPEDCAELAISDNGVLTTAKEQDVQSAEEV